MMPKEASLDDCLELVNSLQVATGLVTTSAMVVHLHRKDRKHRLANATQRDKDKLEFFQGTGCSVEHILL